MTIAFIKRVQQTYFKRSSMSTDRVPKMKLRLAEKAKVGKVPYPIWMQVT